MNESYSTTDLLKKVFLNPLMLMFAFIEPTSGVLRNGIMQWYTIFGHEVKQPDADLILANWGLLLCLFGIVGRFAGGLVSDNFFQSRPGPPAAIFSAFMLMMAAVMAMNIFGWPFVVGLSALLIVAAVTGVHSLMSGTAAADFGGRKATATCSGIIDGFVYLGSGIQSLGVGYFVTHHGWQWWPVFLIRLLCSAVLSLIASRTSYALRPGLTLRRWKERRSHQVANTQTTTYSMTDQSRNVLTKASLAALIAATGLATVAAEP